MFNWLAVESPFQPMRSPKVRIPSEVPALAEAPRQPRAAHLQASWKPGSGLDKPLKLDGIS